MVYYETVPLFTEAEKNFLSVLDKATDYRVFGKSRIADIVKPKKGLSRKEWNKHFWAVSSKHFDYVLCERESLEVVCVIELNDSSHNRADRTSRDMLVQRVCDSSSLPLLWVPASRNYLVSDISRKIEEAIREG